MVYVVSCWFISYLIPIHISKGKENPKMLCIFVLQCDFTLLPWTVELFYCTTVETFWSNFLFLILQNWNEI